ncbi:MAG: hypothetical protein KKC03_00325 [Bacteroidetes bacterium]|nr:hypothetical protein [Bacteroidota bacterium]
MRVVWYLLALLALALAVFNLVQMDLNDPFSKDSTIALGSAIVSLCVLVIIFIYLISKSIKDKMKS